MLTLIILGCCQCWHADAGCQVYFVWTNFLGLLVWLTAANSHIMFKWCTIATCTRLIFYNDFKCGLNQSTAVLLFLTYLEKRYHPSEQTLTWILRAVSDRSRIRKAGMPEPDPATHLLENSSEQKICSAFAAHSTGYSWDCEWDWGYGEHIVDVLSWWF